MAGLITLFKKQPPDATGPPKPEPPKRKHPISPPEDGRCLINTVLPPELLTYIFELGCMLDPEEEDPWDEYESDGEVEEGGDRRALDNDSLSSNSSWKTADSGPGVPSSDADGPSPPAFPVLVSHVCRHWREVALNTPFLWSVIRYDGSESMEQNEVFLSRSRDVPLGLTIDCSIDDDMRDDQEDLMLSDLETAREHPMYTDLQKFLRIITPHCARWRTLEVMVSHYPMMQLVLETLGACPPAPILEILQLYHYEEAQTLTFDPPQLKKQDFVLFQGDVPRLAVVALWGVHLNWARSTFLSGLTELELAYHAPDVRPSYREFLRILQTSPQLRSLSLCQSGPSGGPVEWLESITGETDTSASTDTPRTSPLAISIPVTTLVLAFLPPDYVLSLLERISIPDVTSLTLDFDEDEYTTVMSRLSTPGLGGGRKSIFARLTELRISGLPCSDAAAIAQALSELQHLEDLKLNFRHIDMIWFVLLSRPERVEGTNARIYCPQLHVLTLTGLDGSTVRELVDEREQREHPLKRVFMDEEDELSMDDQDWLEEHLEALEFFEGSDDEDDFEDDDDDDEDDDDDDGDDFYTEWEGDSDEDEEEEDDVPQLTLANTEGVEEDDGDDNWTDDTNSDGD